MLLPFLYDLDKILDIQFYIVLGFRQPNEHITLLLILHQVIRVICTNQKSLLDQLFLEYFFPL